LFDRDYSIIDINPRQTTFATDWKQNR